MIFLGWKVGGFFGIIKVGKLYKRINMGLRDGLVIKNILFFCIGFGWFL